MIYKGSAWYALFVKTGEENLVKERLDYRFGGDPAIMIPKKIIKERKNAELSYDSLKKMKTVLKRAKYFITVKGKYYGNTKFEPTSIKDELRLKEVQKQISIYDLF